MAQTTLNADEAVFIDGDAGSETTNFSGTPQLDVGRFGAAGELRRSLVQFDFSSIPSTVTVTGATFKFYNSGTDLTDNARVMSAYRVIRNWVEGEVTWNIYSTGNNWGTAGCSNTSTDREAAAIGTISVVNPPSAGYMNSTFNVSKVQDWVDGGFTNNGLIWVMATESSDMQRFQGEDEANVPQLVVDYTPAAAQVIII